MLYDLDSSAQQDACKLFISRVTYHIIDTW